MTIESATTPTVKPVTFYEKYYKIEKNASWKETALKITAYILSVSLVFIVGLYIYFHFSQKSITVESNSPSSSSSSNDPKIPKGTYAHVASQPTPLNSSPPPSSSELPASSASVPAPASAHKEPSSESPPVANPAHVPLSSSPPSNPSELPAFSEPASVPAPGSAPKQSSSLPAAKAVPAPLSSTPSPSSSESAAASIPNPSPSSSNGWATVSRSGRLQQSQPDDEEDRSSTHSFRKLQPQKPLPLKNSFALLSEGSDVDDEISSAPAESAVSSPLFKRFPKVQPVRNFRAILTDHLKNSHPSGRLNQSQTPQLPLLPPQKLVQADKRFASSSAQLPPESPKTTRQLEEIQLPNKIGVFKFHGISHSLEVTYRAWREVEQPQADQSAPISANVNGSNTLTRYHSQLRKAQVCVPPSPEQISSVSSAIEDRVIEPFATGDGSQYEGSSDEVAQLIAQRKAQKPKPAASTPSPWDFPPRSVPDINGLPDLLGEWRQQQQALANRPLDLREIQRRFDLLYREKPEQYPVQSNKPQLLLTQESSSSAQPSAPSTSVAVRKPAEVAPSLIRFNSRAFPTIIDLLRAVPHLVSPLAGAFIRSITPMVYPNGSPIDGRQPDSDGIPKIEMIEQ